MALFEREVRSANVRAPTSEAEVRASRLVQQASEAARKTNYPEAMRLLDEADRSASNTEQSQLLADMNALDRLRRGDRLVNQVLQESELTDAVSEPEAQSGELTLVDPDEFERWLEASRAHTVLEKYGNAIEAGVPIAFDEAVRAGRLEPGDLAILTAFGAGWNWGAILLRW